MNADFSETTSLPKNQREIGMSSQNSAANSSERLAEELSSAEALKLYVKNLGHSTAKKRHRCLSSELNRLDSRSSKF